MLLLIPELLTSIFNNWTEHEPSYFVFSPPKYSVNALWTLEVFLCVSALLYLHYNQSTTFWLLDISFQNCDIEFVAIYAAFEKHIFNVTDLTPTYPDEQKATLPKNDCGIALLQECSFWLKMT